MTQDDPTVHVDPALSPARDESEPIRRGPLRAQPAPYDESHTPTGFAPVHFRAQCVDSVGYKRRLHEYAHESRDGTRCIYCGHLRPWEPL